jgi:hypothetical protein
MLSSDALVVLDQMHTDHIALYSHEIALICQICMNRRASIQAGHVDRWSVWDGSTQLRSVYSRMSTIYVSTTYYTAMCLHMVERHDLVRSSNHVALPMSERVWMGLPVTANFAIDDTCWWLGGWDARGGDGINYYHVYMIWYDMIWYDMVWYWCDSIII